MSVYIEMSGVAIPTAMHNKYESVTRRRVKRSDTHEIKYNFSSILFIYTCPIHLDRSIHKGSDSIKILYAVG